MVAVRASGVTANGFPPAPAWPPPPPPNAASASMAAADNRPNSRLSPPPTQIRRLAFHDRMTITISPQ